MEKMQPPCTEVCELEDEEVNFSLYKEYCCPSLCDEILTTWREKMSRIGLPIYFLKSHK